MRETTNENVSSILFHGYTNFFYKSKQKNNTANLQDEYEVKSRNCLSGLKNIGTPKVINKLNAINKKIRKKFTERDANYYTILPDRFPKESEKWLLSYPVKSVQKNMARCWLKSTSPETIRVIHKYILQLENLSTNDFKKRELEKHLSEIKSLKRRLKRLAKEYHRWVLDDKTRRINYGCYNDECWIKHRLKVLQKLKNKK